MKIGAIACCLIAVAWTLLAIVQLWFAPLSGEVFLKASITAGLLFAVVLVVTLALREYASEKKLKDGGYLDD